MAPTNTKNSVAFDKGSNADDNTNNKRGKNSRTRNKDSRNKTTKARKKPTFIGHNKDKVNAVVSDELGLEPLSTQLEKLEREVVVYAQSAMTTYVAASIRDLTIFDFDDSPLMPTPIDPSKYTTPVTGGTPIIDAAKKEIYDNILKSKISAFVKMSQQHDIYMQQIYGIIYGNLDQSIQSLIMGDPSFDSVQRFTDPIQLIKLLRKMCRKEKGVDYAFATFHSCLYDLITCKQGNDTINEFMETIKLRYDVISSQFGHDWIPTQLKDNVQAMHAQDTMAPNWSAGTYMACTESEKNKIDGYAKDRLLAYIGVNGYAHKMPGGLTLKSHINNSAALNNNATTCYPSDLTALLKLTSSMVNTNPQRANNTNNNNNRDKSRTDHKTTEKEAGRDGTNFVQTDGASQSLMTGFSNHDDSDLYGMASFLQTAEVWYSNPDCEADDDSISTTPPPLIEQYPDDSSDDDSDLGHDESSEVDDDAESVSTNNTDITDSSDSTASSFHGWNTNDEPINADSANFTKTNSTDTQAALVFPETITIINDDDVALVDEDHEGDKDHDGDTESLEQAVLNLASAQLRTDAKWSLHVLTKLHRINIFTTPDLVERLSDINTDLRNKNLTTLHKTTIDGLLNPTTFDTTPPTLTGLLHVLQATAKATNKSPDWAHACLYKLRLISIQSTATLIDCIDADTVNTTLHLHGHRGFHRITLLTLLYALKRHERGEVGHHSAPKRPERGEVGLLHPERGEVCPGTQDADHPIDTHCRERGEVSPLFIMKRNNTLHTTAANETTYSYSDSVHTLLTQFKKSGRIINQSWILLDSGSTIHLFTNGDLLTNIQKAPNGEHITVNTTAGSVTTNLQGELPGFGTVWHHPNGIANVLSLGLVTMELRTTMDTSIDNSINVHKKDGTIRRFTLSPTGLYYSDVTDCSGSVLTITTVKDQQAKYSALDIRRATAARKLQTTIGHPSIKEFIRIVETNLLNGCGTNRKDIMIAEDVFGTNGSGLKGKTTTPSTKHLREELIPIPDFIIDNYKEVTLCVDILYVNGIPFVTSVSRHIYFTTVEAVHNSQATTLVKCIRGIVGLYHKRGLQVTTMIADNQFDCLTEPLAALTPGIEYIPLSKGEHEKFVERNNRFVKERCRCAFAEMPYQRIPKRMTIRLVYTTVFWINSFPRQQGVSETMGPRLLLSGIKPSVLHAKYQFGEYFQTHEESKNDMSERTLDAIFTGPIGNAQGGFYAINLKTGQQIKRFRATTLPITDTIISRVHELADKENVESGLIFGDRNNATTIHDLNADNNSQDDDASDGDYSDGSDFEDVSLRVDSDEEEETDPAADQHVEEQIDNADNNYYAPINNNDEGSDSNSSNAEPDAPGDESEPEDDATQNDPAADITDDDDQDEVRDTDQPTSADTPPTNNPEEEREETEITDQAPSVRPQRAAGYTHPVTGERTTTFTRGWSNAMAAYEHVEEIRKLTNGHANKAGLIDYIQRDTSNDQKQGLGTYVNHMLMTQYGIKKGLELFEQEGIDAVLKELQQMHDLKVVEPIEPSKVTKEMRQKALNYLMFLKRKRTGDVKGRGCADGRKQKLYVRKEDSAAPTVGTPALIISCLQDADERRDVATIDIPGAFLQTEQPEDDEVVICFEGPMVDALIHIDPATYKDKVQIVRNGKKILYAKAKKAIYGTVRAAYLFWLKLYKSLIKWGFIPNPYDHCTVNRMFGNDQCTIQWHVDDLKISCKNSKVVDSVIAKLRKYYGKVAPLTERRGKVHEYLGMTIDYSTQDKVTFKMFDYITDIIESLPDDMKGSAISPASNFLFRVDETNMNKLDKQGMELFHHYTAQLLFLSKRARPDLQTAVAFLCTRVHEPDSDDYGKLARVMKYLQQTPHLPLILGSDGKGNIYWSVDAAFAVHNDMRGHTGAHMSFGQGTVIGISSKQKMNTRSSTEAELVGVDQPLPLILWSRLFSAAQGMNIDDNILYQDNESAIRMEQNGKASCTKRTKHIEIRYFYITDKSKSGEITIEHCPTKEMIGDYFTKPLAGSLFKKFRNIILGINDADMPKYRTIYHKAMADRKAKELAILNRRKLAANE